MSESVYDAEKAELCPMNKPELFSAVNAATAPALLVDVGRMTEHRGRPELMN